MKRAVLAALLALALALGVAVPAIAAAAVAAVAAASAVTAASAASVATAASVAMAVAGVGQTTVLDDFHDVRLWRAQASDQVKARVEQDSRGATCLHYDFGAVSGYAVARRVLPPAQPLLLPAHYAMRLTLRGQGAANAFQLKLVDASGDNVWWRHWPDYSPPARSSTLKIRQRQIEFAWGPTTDKQLKQAAALELVVASGRGGGAGVLCFEQLALQTLAAPGVASAPVIRRTATATMLDLGAATEFNGLQWRWHTPENASTNAPKSAPKGAPKNAHRDAHRDALAHAHAPAHASTPTRHNATVQLSDDGHHWRTVHRLANTRREQPLLWLPDSEARFVRIRSRSRVADLRWPGPGTEPGAWPDHNALLKALAATAPRSHHPRSLHSEQDYWTVVGVDGGGAHAALLSEDGAIEPQRAGPSLAPLLLDGNGQASGQASGQTLGWAEVQITQTLREGHLPLPQVAWAHARAGLTLDVAADGNRSNAGLIARYTVHNPTAQRQRLTLALQLRPWQVNPPQQFLNTPGGVASVQRLAWQAGSLWVNGRPWLHTIEPPARVLAARFDAADVLGPAGAPLTSLTDPQALASASLQWPLDLAPGERRSIHLQLPLAGAPPRLPHAAAADARMEAVADAWRARLNRVSFTLPPAAQTLHHSLRAALAHILIQRDGPALQPGTRSYARSWIRDGAMMVAGLLRLGEVDAARDFVRWYATQLFANGKVPCCVDKRGADPVAENDSHGQFIFAVAELWRHTGDRALISALWPPVDAAARYMAQLSDSERDLANPAANLAANPAAHPAANPAAHPAPGNAAFFGMMPASISHEGYSAKPMHSYWDNFWALAGWRDAVLLARALGQTDRADELAAQHQRFEDDLARSLASTMARHQIAYLPGAAELGDFDPTSSTMIFSPAGAESLVPAAALATTWQRYWDEAQGRRNSTAWLDYTPYELRSVSALLRLGHPERALVMLDFFHHDQRPAGWHQWAEVVGRLPREPRFIGDMPHAWIASDYIRSGLDLLAYTRDSDQALVLAAGVPDAWLASGPVGVAGLGTAFGPLGYRLARQAGQAGQAGQLELTVAPGLRNPPGGLWLAQGGRLVRLPAPQPGVPLVWHGAAGR